jgi:peptidoglycan/xylan/chitin deacetylase (PgdA/CDA1 family)
MRRIIDQRARRCYAPAMCMRCHGERRRILLAAALLPAALAAAPARAGAHVMPRLRLAPRAGGPPRVALTLDACSGRADLRVFDGLVRLGLPATIFVTGLWLRANPRMVAMLRERADPTRPAAGDARPSPPPGPA